jgi:DNA invertase Pin-like site-specific DNA recombinase
MKRGRPALSEKVVQLIIELKASGMAPGTIARKLGIGETSARRYLRKARSEAAKTPQTGSEASEHG